MSRTPSEINEEYTKVCQQLGDVVVKMESFEAARKGLIQKVAQLNDEMNELLAKAKKTVIELKPEESK